jgi:lysophospholipase L1-like esterase
MGGQPATYWFSTWAAPPVEAYPDTEFANLTTRQIFYATLAGSQVRLRISNLYGTVPLVIGAAHIAVPTGPDTIDTATDTALTFGGSRSVSIPAGSVAVSDATNFTVAANTDYAISIYTALLTGPATSHLYSSHYSYAAPGNQVSNGSMNKAFSLGASIFFVSGLDVAGTSSTGGIVAIGDSITDGYGSTFGTDTSWPDVLATLLAGQGSNAWAVADAGISGNGLLANYTGLGGLARFDSDVLAQPGTTQVIEALGIVDLALGGTNQEPSAADVIAGLQQLIDRAHDKGLTIYGATITPAGGSIWYNSAFEEKRQAVNSFVRSGAFDGVLDFDAAVADPQNPTQLQPAYDSGDHLDPNSAGYAVMAATYPLNANRRKRW